VTQPVVEDTGSFLNNVLDEIDLSDPAAVTSSVTSILSVMTKPPPKSVNLQSCFCLGNYQYVSGNELGFTVLSSKAAFTPDTCSRIQVSQPSNMYLSTCRRIQVLSSVLLADTTGYM